jgi:hypothetical protein
MAEDHKSDLRCCDSKQDTDDKIGVTAVDKGAAGQPSKQDCGCCCHSEAPKPTAFGWDWWFDSPTSLFNGLLVIVGATQAVFLWRAVKETGESTRISKQALVDVQRAFVFIKMFEVSVINNNIVIMPQWENSGYTPATQKINWVSWQTFVGEIPPNFYTFDFNAQGRPVPAGSEDLPPTFIGPHATQFADALTIPIAIMEEVRTWNQRLFVWGWIEYRDAFDGTPIHRTEFCNEVMVTSISRDEVTKETKAALRFALYGPYNTAK